MKIFVVFLAILLLNVSYLSQSADLDRYSLLQRQLKVLAEEGACGAALFRDEDEYALGRLCVDRQAAEAYLDFLLANQRSLTETDPSATVEGHIEVFDDASGYGDADRYGISGASPAVVVELEWSGEDLFRLPFVSVTRLRRSATYQWAGGLTSALE